MIDSIIAYEQGELSGREELKLFAELISTGAVWDLQGSYGRTARTLIDYCLIDDQGNILIDLED